MTCQVFFKVLLERLVFFSIELKHYSLYSYIFLAETTIVGHDKLQAECGQSWPGRLYLAILWAASRPVNPADVGRPVNPADLSIWQPNPADPAPNCLSYLHAKSGPIRLMSFLKKHYVHSTNSNLRVFKTTQNVFLFMIIMQISTCNYFQILIRNYVLYTSINNVIVQIG